MSKEFKQVLEAFVLEMTTRPGSLNAHSWKARWNRDNALAKGGARAINVEAKGVPGAHLMKRTGVSIPLVQV